MTEPITLSEFGALLGSDRPLTEAIVAYAAALTALHEAEASEHELEELCLTVKAERDDANKKLADLRAQDWETATYAMRDERDALAAELAELRAAAEKLWQLLDDIDTLSDMTKGDREAFFAHAMRISMKRHELAISDGYTLDWLPALAAGAAPEPQEGGR